MILNEKGSRRKNWSKVNWCLFISVDVGIEMAIAFLMVCAAIDKKGWGQYPPAIGSAWLPGELVKLRHLPRTYQYVKQLYHRGKREPARIGGACPFAQHHAGPD
jgi:hypothetical protein